MSTELIQEFKNFQTGFDSQFTELSASLNSVQKRLDGIETVGRYHGEQGREPENLLSDLLLSDDFARFKTAGFRGKMAMRLAGKSFLDIERKATITSTTLGSAVPGVLTPQRLDGVYGPGQRRTRVRDLFISIPTTQNACDWVKENVFTNASSPVAETISKPESALTFVADSVKVATIAHWLPISRQAFDDSPAVAQYCSARLLDGLATTLDFELVLGDGSNQHLSGLVAEATAYDTARNVASDTKIDKINHGVSQLEDSNFTPNFVLLNPRDWRAIQLVKEDVSGANTGSYLMGGPQQDGGRTLWDCTIVRTTAIPVGKFIIGDSLYAVILDRMSPVVEISSEHQDFFVKNLLAVRCEQRAAFAVTRGDAFVYASF